MVDVDNWFADKPFYIHPDGDSWYTYCHCGRKFSAWIQTAPEAFIQKYRTLLDKHLSCGEPSPDGKLRSLNPAPSDDSSS